MSYIPFWVGMATVLFTQGELHGNACGYCNTKVRLWHTAGLLSMMWPCEIRSTGHDFLDRMDDVSTNMGDHVDLFWFLGGFWVQFHQRRTGSARAGAEHFIVWPRSHFLRQHLGQV